jgi:hypothetical protein
MIQREAALAARWGDTNWCEDRELYQVFSLDWMTAKLKTVFLLQSLEKSPQFNNKLFSSMDVVYVVRRHDQHR